MVSGGNFQALPLALGFEALRLALAHVASASERRTAALSAALAPARASGAARLPGLTLYSAAAAVAELRQLAAPVTLGFTTLSGVEDHASLAPVALQLAQRSLALTGEVLAIEALHAADLLQVQGVTPTGAGTGRLSASLDELTASGAPAAELVPGALALRAECRAQCVAERAGRRRGLKRLRELQVRDPLPVVGEIELGLVAERQVQRDGLGLPGAGGEDDSAASRAAAPPPPAPP